MSQSARLSIALPIVAQYLTDILTEAAGEEIAFVLVCQADGVAQYVSNTERADGAALIESLMERWKAGRADIPAHYNPDLAANASFSREPERSVGESAGSDSYGGNDD